MIAVQYTRDVGRKILLIAIAFFTLAIVAKPVNADFLPRRGFVDTVISVNNLGIMTFEQEGSYRLWGVLPEISVFRKVAVGSVLACEVAGKTRGHRRSVEVVQCSIVELSSDAITLSSSKEMSQVLIESRHGVELCFETLNWFGTCDVD